MFITNVFLLFYFVDTLYAEASIDINRVQKITEAENDPRVNDQTHHSKSRNRWPIQYINKSSSQNSTKRAYRKISSNPYTSTRETSAVNLQPREDPRLFYQSDAYLQETNVNYEVASIYPGGHITNANKHTNSKQISSRLTNGEEEQLRDSVCVTCPRDRTVVAKSGSDRVLFLKPRLAACSANEPLRNIRIELIYGPQFGSLLVKGTHVVVGRIYADDRPLQLCKMQVHVITQSCPVPSYLIKHCHDYNDQKKQCGFSCRNPKLELQGPSHLSCENNRRWSKRLPVCKVKTSCEPPLPPSHGWISCKGSTMADGGFQEGSKCRVKCARGWRRSSHTTICRRGAWTKNLFCS